MAGNAGRLTNQAALNEKSQMRVRAPKKMVTVYDQTTGEPKQVPAPKKNRQRFTGSRLVVDYCMHCKGTIGLNEKGITVLFGRRVHASC